MNSKSYCSAIIPNPNPNPNTITSPNSMQALHFIQALARISRAAPKPPTTTHSSRTRKIRRAAYASMACASGPRRTWSRTLLRRLRQRRQPAAGRLLTVRRRVRVLARPVASCPDEPARADTLRRLVPGGLYMEYCNLLEEAADYVQCLRAQVQLMQSLVDAFSP